MERSTGFFAATTVIASVVALYLWQELRNERLLNVEASAPAAPAALQTAVLPSSPPPIAEPRGEDAAVHVAALQGPAPPVGESADVKRICDALRARTRQNFGQTSVPWMGRLQLTPTEQDQVSQLQARQAGLVTGLAECGDGAPINTLEFDAAMRELLGPGRYEQYRDAQAEFNTEMNMTTLKTQVAGLGAPLTDDQAAKLAELINSENRRSRQESTMRPPSQDPRDLLESAEEELEITTRRFERVLAGARTLLTAEQYRQLEANMQRQLLQTRESLDRRRRTLDAGGVPLAVR